MPVDPTVPAIIGGAIISKDLVLKLLGPTAEYLGEGLKDWTERALRNTGKVFEVAAKKLGPRIDEEGGVPPKVLKGILQEAPFADDELAVGYLGGVLASSRSGTSRDDRAATLISLIGRLSTYQLRTHYVFYRIFRDLFVGRELNIGLSTDRAMMRVFIPLEVWIEAMGFEGEEEVNAGTILTHTLWGLNSENLIEEDFAFGQLDVVKMMYPAAEKPGVVIEPSALGLHLFLAAYGKYNESPLLFLKSESQFEALAEVAIPSGSVPTQQLLEK